MGSDTFSGSTLHWGGDPHPPTSVALREWSGEPSHLTLPWGCFPSRTRCPSGEAGSSEGEHLPPALVPASRCQAWPLPYRTKATHWMWPLSNHSWGVWPACSTGLAAFAFTFLLVSWGPITHFLAPGPGQGSQEKEQDGITARGLLGLTKLTASPELGRWGGEGGGGRDPSPPTPRPEWGGGLGAPKAVVLKVWWPHHLGTGQKCPFQASTPDLLTL